MEVAAEWDTHPFPYRVAAKARILLMRANPRGKLMTVLTAVRKTEELPANATQREWPFSFPYLSADHIAVYHTVAGTETLISPALYTVVAATGDIVDGYIGGTVTYPLEPTVPLATGTIRIERVVPYLQDQVELSATSGFDPNALERAFDLAAQGLQQLSDFAAARTASVDAALAAITLALSGGTSFPELTPQQFGAVGDGTTDDSAAFAAAALVARKLLIPAGDYLIDANVTFGPTVTLAFEPGARLVVGEDVTISVNGKIFAGPYQHIFTGDLIQSAYSRTTSSPYVFGVQGAPKVEWASPWWFGAAGDSTTDDQGAIYCALYFANRCYLPAATYAVDTNIQLRKNNQTLFGASLDSRLKWLGATDEGAVVSIRGIPPATSSGPPQDWISGCRVYDISIDGAAAENTNGIGVSWAQAFSIERCYFIDIGRKAITMQYWCREFNISDNVIETSGEEPTGTFGAITVEGQFAGLNHTVEGGVNGTDDLEGADMHGGRLYNNHIRTSQESFIVLQRCNNIKVHNGVLGNAGTGGTHINFSSFTSNCLVAGLVAGTAVRRHVFVEDTSTECRLENVFFGGVTGTNSDGYAVHVKGTGFLMTNVSLASANTAAALTVDAAVYAEASATGLRIEHMRIRSVEAGVTGIVSLAAETDIDKLEFPIAGERAVRVTGARSRVRNSEIDSGSATTAISVEGADSRAQDNVILGAGSNRILVGSSAVRCVVTGNTLPGGGSITVNAAALPSSAVHSNPGNTSTSDTLPLGAGSVWIDATGDLRVSAGVRTGDTDGTVVGTQS